MYSVVLMAAMTTTPVTPDGLLHRGGGGCCGQQASCGCGGGHGGRHHKHRGHGCCGGGNECGCTGGCGGCNSGCGCCGGGMAMGCGCYGGGMMMAPMGPAPQGGTPMPTPREGAAPAGGAVRPMGMANPNAATLVVTGAQDATVTIGGLVSAAARGDTRVMVSPALEAGQVYEYDLTAEVVRDGQTVKLTRAVTVRPGETTQVNLDFAAGQVAMK
jgi:uncharacterized protein (TIGR03000 family)